MSLPVLTADNFYALKTIGGGIFHCLNSKSSNILPEHHLNVMYFLKLPKDTIHCYYLFGYGFMLETRTLTMQYVHNQFSH